MFPWAEGSAYGSCSTPPSQAGVAYLGLRSLTSVSARLGRGGGANLDVVIAAHHVEFILGAHAPVTNFWSGGKQDGAAAARMALS